MTTVHCPSCDGYQTDVMDDGQRSVGVCEGVEARTVETAEEWEYGIRMDDSGTDYWNVPNPRAHVKEWSGTSLVRRRPAGKPEPVPPTPEEPVTARECGNDSHHGYGTGYCGDCTKEAADAD